MRRVMYHGIGDLRLEEMAMPEPGPGEIVIENEVTLTCGTDVKMYRRGYRFDPPHPIGHEAAGVVSAVGPDVTRFVPGDRVVAHNTAPCQACRWCKRGQHSLCPNLLNNLGGYAEYWRIPAPIVEQNTFAIPESMSFRQAALTEPFSCAVYGIDQVDIQPGDVVAVNGCGPIGLMFVRLAICRGAQVIASDVSTTRLEVAERLGAFAVVSAADPVEQVRRVRALTEHGRGADVVIEAAGLPEVWSLSVEMVRTGGAVLLFGGTAAGTTVTFDCARIHYDQITLKGVYHTTPEHVARAFDLLRAGVVDAADFVQNEYPIEETEQALLQHGSGAVIKNCVVYA